MPRTAALLGIGLLVTACGREPVVRLTDFAPYQRDQVTTRSVPAHAELAPRLAADGWRVEPDDDGVSKLRTTRDRARIWFYSVDGRPWGVELAGEITGGPDASPRALYFRLNDSKRSATTLRESDGVLDVRFRPGSARTGWNALDLMIARRGSKDPGPSRLELRGFRVVDGAEGIADEGPQTIRVEDGVLAMPGESRLQAAFEVPSGGRFKARVTSDLGDSEAGELVGSVELLDAGGALHRLGGFRLDTGDEDRVDLELDAWRGQIVELRLSVAGPRAASVLVHDGGIYGHGERQSADALIRPAPATKSGRLGRPDVFLIVLDAARADAFGTYGARHPTPAVDALAAAGTRFEDARSPSSWTGQAVPAMLTGFHPDTLHTERWGDPLPAEVPHVAELMADAGYRTVLWSQHPIYTRTESLLRGFEHVHYNGRRKRDVLPAAPFLLERDRPTFALIHLLPPHSPYRPPAPFRGAYTTGYRGKLPTRLGALGRIGKKRMLKLTAADRDYIRGRYLENVAFADHLVGRLIETLRRRGRLESALIVVTSDHGEAFLEHGQFMHSRELYQEFIRVPLVVKWPADVPAWAPSVESPAGLIDLVPTLVDGLGLAGGERGFQGRSLLPAAFDGSQLERALYATTRGIGDLTRMAKPRGLLEEAGWRVLHDPIGARTELFRAADDPGETAELSREHPTRARLLLQRLLIQSWFNRQLLRLGPRAEVELDPEMVEELKALGYL